MLEVLAVTDEAPPSSLAIIIVTGLVDNDIQQANASTTY